MSPKNDLFSFKQFDIRQQKTPFKVGTDGVLLGSWAGHHNPQYILDIGTGTGLIALMLAQRFPEALVHGIELQKDAAEEAKANAMASPFSRRIVILHEDFLHWEPDLRYDLIVSNPPYFKDSLPSTKPEKLLSRHQHSLPLHRMIKKSANILREEGIIALILPVNIMSEVEEITSEAGLYPFRKCHISSHPFSPPIRIMQEWSLIKHEPYESSLNIYDENGRHSDLYRLLTQEFHPWI